LETFGEGDLEGIMEDYAADAVLVSGSDVRRGHEEIEPFFVDLFEEFDDPSVSFSMEQRTVVDEYAYIVWNAETPDKEYEFATDTFVVRDGEIVAQTFAAKVSQRS
jgi:hypothetical protein